MSNHTQFKVFDFDKKSLTFVKKLVNVQECKVYGLNAVITTDKQLSDGDIGMLMEKVKNILILTQHFWFSEKQYASEDFRKKIYPYCLIDGNLFKYTQSNDTSNYPMSFTDSEYLGYGLKDWKTAPQYSY